jgi:uncharacterized membrane protein (DUF2068 family)
MQAAKGADILDSNLRQKGLRTVAVFEALKGAIVLAAGLGLLSLLHRDVEVEAEHLVRFLHMNPDGHISASILRVAAGVTEAKVLAAAGATITYSIVRFVEAYGLWHCYVWAEWFALLSGGLYLPWEIYKVAERPTWIHWLVFSINIVIVLYVLYVRVRSSRDLR